MSVKKAMANALTPHPPPPCQMSKTQMIQDLVSEVRELKATVGGLVQALTEMARKGEKKDTPKGR